MSESRGTVMTEVPSGEIAVSVNADALPVRVSLIPGGASPPVPVQRSSHINAAKLESEKVVISAPLSYAGSAARIWKLTGITDNMGGRIALGLAAIILILAACSVVTAWYLIFGLLLVPYRLVRRSSRKSKREALQHREMMAAIQARSE
jgi:hypothetical protein